MCYVIVVTVGRTDELKVPDDQESLKDMNYA